MDIEIHYKTANTAAKFLLRPGEEVTAESGSMICMSPHVDIQTTTYKKGQGNILRSLKRMIAGESFFLNHYTARAESELWLSSVLPGDLQVLELHGENLIVQSGSFLACESTLNLNVGWQGFKNLLSGESLFWLQLSGKGKLLLSSFGAIYEKEVDGEYIVDSGHIVAFEETLNFSISKAGNSWMHSFLGGEGLVCRFKGKGKLWCQSHNQREFGYALRPFLRPKKQ